MHANVGACHASADSATRIHQKCRRANYTLALISTGHVIDIILDVGFIAYGIYDIAANGYTAERGLALGADVAAAVIPGVTGAGMAVRGANAAVDGVRATNATVDAAKATCSFAADTLVLTDKGTAPIAEIAIGDTVLTYHEGLQATGHYSVTAVWAHTDPVVVTLVIDGEVIETTPEHPFFVTGRGWTPAAQVVAGTAIQQADGTSGIVQATQLEQRSQVMYNFTVADAHTYFVGAGGWLVHNACGGKIPLIGGGTDLPKGSEWTNVNDITHGNPPDVAYKLDRARTFLKDGWDPERAVGLDILPDGTKVARQGNHRLAVTREMGYDEIPTRVLRDQRGRQ
jgi:hypothetical protein